jgi:hypothetical protein
MDFGDIEVTTTVAPEGTGATYSPNFFQPGPFIQLHLRTKGFGRCTH